MSIVSATHKNIELAVNLIKKGELVAFPTETVYGLGADGLNAFAVTKIFEVKKRPSFNPLILHISNLGQLNLISECKNEKVETLIDEFWPGPLTLVVPKKNVVPEIVTAGNSTVAVRMPNHPVALELIELNNNPIAAPSANMFGQLSPTTAEHVQKQLGGKVSLILNGGSCKVGVESTILGVSDNEVYLLRPGGISTEEIENIIGKISKNKNISGAPESPGQLPYHYAPRIPIRFLDKESIDKIDKDKTGLLLFKSSELEGSFKIVKVLSANGNLREAAANLFSHLHDLEKEGISEIYVERLPERGLGIAIMDRLKKAVNKYT